VLEPSSPASVCEKYHSSRSKVNRSARDHASPDHAVALIPDHGLSGRHRPLRRVEDDLGAVAVERADGGRCCRVVVTDLASTRSGSCGGSHEMKLMSLATRRLRSSSSGAPTVTVLVWGSRSTT